MTDELLQVLWTVERTLAMSPELSTNLNKVILSPLFSVAELPQPEPWEREAPSDATSDQVEMNLPASAH